MYFFVQRTKQATTNLIYGRRQESRARRLQSTPVFGTSRRNIPRLSASTQAVLASNPSQSGPGIRAAVDAGSATYHPSLPCQTPNMLAGNIPMATPTQVPDTVVSILSTFVRSGLTLW
jgi:hypothetical protein